MTKDELIDALEDERERFIDALEGLSDVALQEPGVVGDWSVKNILSHLSGWEAEIIKLMYQIRANQAPATLHFSKTSVDLLNRQMYLETRDRPLEAVMLDFQSVRLQTLKRVEAFSSKELNDPELFIWLKGRPLWEWIAGDSFEHEAEHREQIMSWRAQRGYI